MEGGHYLWSSTPKRVQNSNAWRLDFLYGYVSEESQGWSGMARLVKDAPALRDTAVRGAPPEPPAGPR